MSSYHLSTKERLLAIVDDIEIISKELIENTIAPKHQKMSSADHGQLVELLVSKDKELKATLQLAAEQAGIEKKMNGLREQVKEQDEEINQLQKQLKEAEQILATAIFQGRQKLTSINKAAKRPVSSEEMIKFAHRISASNAICAPLTWQQGDLRRPYPTDIEMRLGFLGKSDLNINGHGQMPNSQNNSLNEMQQRNAPDQRLECDLRPANVATGRPAEALSDGHRDAVGIPGQVGPKHQRTRTDAEQPEQQSERDAAKECRGRCGKWSGRHSGLGTESVRLASVRRVAYDGGCRRWIGFAGYPVAQGRIAG
ncbi:hypothetical protein RP20_CCG014549 [Aedes albopictus]|nr:hypothetical protein RP20_CCG014549 [Aedes albopictus]